MSTAYFSLASSNFSENWTNTGRITTNNNWSLVPSITGYLGDIDTAAGIDPRTVVIPSLGAVNVIANQLNPNTLATGGVAEFHLANPTIALNGSGTADAPSIVLYLNAANRENITLSLNLRDLDGSGDNAAQAIAVQYRYDETANWTNVEGGYVADATQGGLATLVTPLSVTLPDDADGQGTLQIRVLTVNAAGNDEWVGIDDIVVTSTAIPDGTPGRITISDASVVEGDGTSQLVFNVSRAGGSSGSATVGYQIGFDTADAADLASGTPLSGTVTFAAGETRKTITLDIAGDVTPERNERLTVTLSPVDGNFDILDGTAAGIIVNDDPIALEIWEIQGRGHRSEFEGQIALTQGVVTAVDSTGFYLQDVEGDGDAATSDAVFVFTRTRPAVAVGDLLQVRGTVAEFAAGTEGLTLTELEQATWTKLGTASVAATVIGAGGRLPPTQAIEDDGLTSYDPATDGIDFYESLEGMLVTVDDAQAVSNTNGFGETYVIASNGAGATGANGRGGITIAPGDFNPERLQIDDDSAIFAGYQPGTQPHTVGDRLGDVTGVINYSFNSYELLVTQAVNVVEDSAPSRELTGLDGTADRVTIASYNVENLDPGDGVRFGQLAGDIVWNLNAPDIIGLQEIQDADGAGNGSNYSGQATADALIAAIAQAGGPTYVYVEIAPTANNTTGGESNGNIRNGYLYDPTRVDYVEGSATLVPGDAFNGTRKPLAAQFLFNGETITAINHHATSRLGSDPLYGGTQPPADAGDAARTAQATAIRAYVDGLVAADPGAKVVVLGDFNGFYFENSLQALQAGGTLTNLYDTLPVAERYSAIFEGNSQGLDNMLVSSSLLAGAQFDVVHINSEQPEGSASASDHDPLVASLFVNRAPVAAADTVAVDEDAATGNLVSLLLGNDVDPNAGDTLSIESVDSSSTLGSVSFDAATQTLVYTADADAFDLLDTGEIATDTLSYTVRDAGGRTSSAMVTFTVTGVADGGAFDGGNGSDVLTGTAGEDLLMGGNGSDRLFGGEGADHLLGGNGSDTLDGGAGIDRLLGGNGNDVLTGGDGADVFVFGRGGGSDIVTDFVVGLDRLEFDDGVAIARTRLFDADGDGSLDTLVSLTNGGGSVTLLGVADFSNGDLPIA